MSQKLGKDLTTGSIPKHLLFISIPMLIGNFLQVAYNLVDAMWVGNKVGEDALGAVGVSFPIFFILIGIASGATIATTILVSQYYGAKDYENVERVVNTSFSITIIFSLILSVLGIIFSDNLLRLMNTPNEIFDFASSYLKIMMAGFTFTFISFLVTSILRGIGDTVTPLIFMALGAVINIVLDPLLIMGVGPFPQLGLNGAAYASLISTIIGCLTGIIYLNSRNHLVSFNIRNLRLDKHIALLILKIGLPSATQQTLVSLGMFVITAFVNVFGKSATTAFAAVGRIDSIAFMPAMSMSMAVSTLTGQNLGAGKPERIKDVFKSGTVMTCIITITISLVAVAIPGFILNMFGIGNSGTEVVEIGTSYLRIVGSSYILFAIMFISNGVINGAGHTMTTMMISLVSLWVIRVPLAWIMSRTNLGLTGVWISMPISFALALAISLSYYYSGKWKKTIIRTNAPEPIIDPD